ncbi:MAG: hypothetical protein JSU07_09870 [Bacteroidetes bacterium]|nr:hypothetical protein [Bacteroidota bacterium]
MSKYKIELFKSKKNDLIYKIFFLLIIVSNKLFAQYFPSNNVVLNYSQVMFQFNEINAAAWYKVSLLDFGSYPANANNKTPNKIEYTDSSTAILINDLKFGHKYQWQVEAYNANNKSMATSSLITFYLMENEYGDTSKYKLTRNYYVKNKCSNGLVWIDTYHCAVNRNGEVVWQFPIIDKYYENPRSIRDLQVLKNGNICYLNDSNIYIIDRDLNVKWYAQKNFKEPYSKIKYFHHAVVVVDSNSIYTLGIRYIKIGDKKNFENKNSIRDTLENYIEDDYILKFNYNGDITWAWRYTTDYYDKNFYNQLSDSAKILYNNPHCNALDIDSAGKYLYLGARNLSRALKINIETKQVVQQIGSKLYNGDVSSTNKQLFYYQHDFRAYDSFATVLNNNSNERYIKDESKRCKTNYMMFSLPKNNKDSCLILNQIYLNQDTFSNQCITHLGSARILKNKNILICGGYNSRIYEYTHSGELVWDLQIKRFIYPKGMKIQDKMQFYRCTYSSSLYPSFFVLCKINNVVKIINKGSESDTYSVKYFKNKKLIKNISLYLKPGDGHFLNSEKGLKIVVKSYNLNLEKEYLCR